VRGTNIKSWATRHTISSVHRVTGTIATPEKYEGAASGGNIFSIFKSLTLEVLDKTVSPEKEKALRNCGTGELAADGTVSPGVEMAAMQQEMLEEIAELFVTSPCVETKIAHEKLMGEITHLQHTGSLQGAVRTKRAEMRNSKNTIGGSISRSELVEGDAEQREGCTGEERVADQTASDECVMGEVQATVNQLMGNDEQEWYAQTFTEELVDLHQKTKGTKGQESGVCAGWGGQAPESPLTHFASTLEAHACDARSPIHFDRDCRSLERGGSYSNTNCQEEGLIMCTEGGGANLAACFAAACASTKRDLSSSFASYSDDSDDDAAGVGPSVAFVEALDEKGLGAVLQSATAAAAQAAREAATLASAAEVLAEVEAEVEAEDGIKKGKNKRPVQRSTISTAHSATQAKIANEGRVLAENKASNTPQRVTKAVKYGQSQIGCISRIVSTPLGTTQIGQGRWAGDEAEKHEADIENSCPPQRPGLYRETNESKNGYASPDLERLMGVYHRIKERAEAAQTTEI
jgi:hypothetical protein